MYNRREWLKLSATVGTGALFSDLLSFCKGKPATIKTILVVSGWQDVNIGDIAHTPGLLNVLQTFLPDTEIILWKVSTCERVKELLERNFPKVRILYGKADADKNVNDPEIMEAFDKADVMIHGSGPYVVAREHLWSWVKHAGKPFGIFGVTIQETDDDLKSLLQKASFIFTRETKSLDVLKKAGLSGNHISFAPDATFYFNLEDPESAGRFLEQNELEEKKFICAIPRLRYTPYYKFKPNNAGWTDEKIKRIDEINERHKERDHAKLRAAMIAWVRDTGNKVLVCPEMTYEVDIMDELLIDPLPEDVKPHVKKHGYWLPDEAASVYSKAHTVLSFECHSAIIAAATGTPFFYLRQPEDTIKGQMYYDLGFDGWTFEIEQTEGIQIANELRIVRTDYGKAKLKVEKSMNLVKRIYKERTGWIGQLI